MKITINEAAAGWYEREMGLSRGDFLRFFARYGGVSTVQQGFSLGVSNDEPANMGVNTEKNGITYYIEEKDIWYFDGQDLIVELDPLRQEPEFKFVKTEADA